MAETAKKRCFVQESIAPVAYGLVWVLALDNRWGSSLLGVRARNVKGVASAVGEGSIAISFVHQVLKE